jgi:hypothetical protein
MAVYTSSDCRLCGPGFPSDFYSGEMTKRSNEFAKVYLRYDCEGLPQCFQSQVRNVSPVDDDLPPGGLDNSKEGEGERGLSGASATHDAHLFTVTDPERDSLEHEVHALPVPGLIVFELDDSQTRPAFRFGRVRLRLPGRSLHWRVLVLADALYAYDSFLDVGYISGVK